MKILPMAKVAAPVVEKDYKEGEVVELAGLVEEVAEEVCCGGAPSPKSNPFERPGYMLESYVRAFVINEKSDIALVKTELEFVDHFGSLLARIGINRDNYRISPGLYGVGNPGEASPVLVTANYKLTFDVLRRELTGQNCWILVLDTCGINVWCAAGKRTFSTEELVYRIEKTALAAKVVHRQLIVPQLGAVGIAAHKVKLQSGFRVVYGPIKAADIPAFLQNDLQPTESMRRVTFTLRERFVLIPVEFYSFAKKIWWIIPLLFMLSGIGPGLFNIDQAVERGLLGSIALILGIIVGGALVPILLPWLPGRRFSVKGASLGLAIAIIGAFLLNNVVLMDKVALILAITGVSSYLAMNFTGSTPFTSPSGVEKEMKVSIPLQAAAIIIAGGVWLVAPFV